VLASTILESFAVLELKLLDGSIVLKILSWDEKAVAAAVAALLVCNVVGERSNPSQAWANKIERRGMMLRNDFISRSLFVIALVFCYDVSY